MLNKKLQIGIIGLGYVGLPLAVEFGKILSTVGFDVNTARIEELKAGNDHTLETAREDMLAANHLIYTSSLEKLKSCNVFIISVPTPVDKNKRPPPPAQSLRNCRKSP